MRKFQCNMSPLFVSAGGKAGGGRIAGLEQGLAAGFHSEGWIPS